jgi:hypothetical protein
MRSSRRNCSRASFDEQHRPSCGEYAYDPSLRGFLREWMAYRREEVVRWWKAFTGEAAYGQHEGNAALQGLEVLGERGACCGDRQPLDEGGLAGAGDTAKKDAFVPCQRPVGAHDGLGGNGAGCAGISRRLRAVPALPARCVHCLRCVP